ncbi:hypothetical protein GCM10018785_62620 [Streptomyces longispororuber]|uniref:Thiopeptide-type bacteriocin biosynthesis domain-containing protein n=1 Tax=Streptomyces longispororuber TaxID=68230 RepID=A0A919DWZ5_9ACTN|nr:thiopeptide-type bacteriocin biosynthesis protein [Streptomyces longispororuber]GHE86340.1 hypothetical protein GCM10018785_62620 [Streptomyces longispororuber]
MIKDEAWELRRGTDALPAFLRRVADGLERGAADEDPRFTRRAGLFLDGGCAAVAAHDEVRWLEYRLTGRAALDGLYAGLARFAQDRLDARAAEDFFFVRKEHTLRVRLRCAPGARDEVDASAVAEWERLCRQGAATGWERAFYEPEAYLFGGERSMDSVHRVFTADSLFWARHHASPPSGARPWVVSLLMIRALFDAMGIVGWEDRHVWDVLRRQAGRTFGATPPDDWRRVADGVRDAWSDAGRLSGLVDDRTRGRVEEFGAALSGACRRWHEEYFGTREAVVGPRRAVAFLIVFHWNRAGLPMPWQAAIAEALFARTGVRR